MLGHCILILSTSLFIASGARRYDKDVVDRLVQSFYDDIGLELKDNINFMKRRYSSNKLALNEALATLAALERQNNELREMILSQQLGNNCSCDTTSCLTRPPSGLKLAIAEHKHGHIYLIDTISQARWTVAAPPGAKGIVYHPILKILYTISDKEINSVSVLLKDVKALRTCKGCFALDLDVRENMLYFLEKDRKGDERMVHVQKMSLVTSKIVSKPLVSYTLSDNARTFTVDDVARRIYVVLNSSIDQLDYSGNLIESIALKGRTMTSVSVTVDKLTGTLYYAIDNDIWKRAFTSNGYQEMIHSSKDDIASVKAAGFRLIVTYRNNRRVDEITRDDVKMLTDLGGHLDQDSLYVCFYD